MQPQFNQAGSMNMFRKDLDWLDFHPAPSKPAFMPPAGAVDAHCHVFGPGDEFPYSPKRKYTPCDAPKEQLFKLRDFLGFERNVIVQASCHGTDNEALVDALINSDGKARGVAVVSPDISDDELQALDKAGVRGVRFNFVKRLVNPVAPEVLKGLAQRIEKLGWHIVIYFEESDLPEYYDFFSSLNTTVVVDHMGRPDFSSSPDSPAFGLFIRLLQKNENFLVKVTCPERLSLQGPPGYDDFIPFASKLVEMFPDRVLWGTDWPHPNMKSHMPDDGLLVDMIPRIAPSVELQKKLLVDNPMRLYWPEEV